MEVKDIITIVFSSTLLTTVITVIFNLLTIKRKDSIENITKERKEWREQLRIISKEIAETKNISELHIAISELKVRINAYGIAENFIIHDSHLWKRIKELEKNPALNDEKLEEVKIYFVDQISCLLKYDWERTKAEIKGNTQTKVVIVSLIVSFFLYSIRWFYYYSLGIGRISSYISYCVLYVIVIAFSISVIYFADKWTNSAYYYIYLGISLLGGISLIFFIFFNVLIEEKFEVIDYIIFLSPYATLLYSAEIKIFLYRKNICQFILATTVASKNNTIDRKYRIFFMRRKPKNIYTDEILKFSDRIVP